MMNKDTLVSVIIVNYNTKELTLNCINSIFEKTISIKFEVILIDNASSDGSKELFEKDNRINYIFSSSNLGFGGGNNLGAKHANGKYLFFLNPDTILLNNAIFILSNFMESKPDAVACGANLFDSENKATHSFRRYLPGIRWELNLLSIGFFDKLVYGQNAQFNHTNHIMRVGYITGADLLIPRSVFEENGGFSSDFFMYYEETDLCRRISSNKRYIYSVPTAKIMHLEGKSFSAEQLNHRRKTVENGYATYRRRNYTRIQNLIGGTIHSIYLKLKGISYRGL